MFLEDETAKKFVEDSCKADLKITAVKEEMKNFPIKQKTTKETELKQLQQQVQTLHDKEQRINEEVTTKNTEAKWVTGPIHPVEKKLQQIT